MPEDPTLHCCVRTQLLLGAAMRVGINPELVSDAVCPPNCALAKHNFTHCVEKTDVFSGIKLARKLRDRLDRTNAKHRSELYLQKAWDACPLAECAKEDCACRLGRMEIMLRLTMVSSWIDTLVQQPVFKVGSIPRPTAWVENDIPDTEEVIENCKAYLRMMVFEDAQRRGLLPPHNDDVGKLYSDEELAAEDEPKSLAT